MQFWKVYLRFDLPRKHIIRLIGHRILIVKLTLKVTPMMRNTVSHTCDRTETVARPVEVVGNPVPESVLM